MSDTWWMILGGIVVGSLCGAVSGILIRRWWDGIGGAQARDAARRWWHSGLSQVPASIKIRNKDGTVSDVRPIRVSGLHLVVEPMSPGKVRTWEIVASGQAVDVEEFWRVWKFLGGKLSGWVDEDGDEFSPGS